MSRSMPIMIMDLLAFLDGNSTYIAAVAIVVTIIAIAISTRYSLRNLLNIGGVNESSEATEEPDRRTENCSACDATGNDGDDEAEPDGEEDDSKLLSPRYPDPVEYCEHIQGEIKRVQQSVATRTIEKSLTEQQLQEEKEVQRKQLSEIFRLMQEQQDRFGIQSMDDMQEQMKLYSV